MHNKDKCPICFELVQRKPKKLSCNHVFHEECITQWYVTADSCPVCRVGQGKDSYIKFRNLVENNMRDKYKDAIDSLEQEVMRLRREVRNLRRRPIILD
jgi:CRISPR/Cas system CSM-associated protein Csm3 (group 7 of RAMP superfamily)